MNTDERMQAEELDAYLSARQAGQQAAEPATLAAEDVDFLEDLLSMAGAHQVDPVFAERLAHRLRVSAPKRGAKMNRLSVFYLAGAAALVMVLFVGVLVLGQSGVLEGLLSAAQAPMGAQPPAVVVDTETPTQPPTGEQPGAVAEGPIVTPPPWPEEPPALPLLGMQMSGGYGGGGGGYAAPDVTFALNAALPEGAGQMAVYAQVPEMLTLPYVEQEAARWGLDGGVYTPNWMVTLQETDDFIRLGYTIIDPPRELSFHGTEVVNYRDSSAVRNTSATHWYPWGSPPPLAQGTATAEQFLRERGLLPESYQVLADSYDLDGRLRFHALLGSGEMLVGPFADVTISPDGRVASVTYHTFNLGSLGDYPIISAQEAWLILSAGEPDDRLWVNVPTSPTRDPRLGNPRFWDRDYPVGQRADVVGSMIVWQSAADGPLYAAINGLVLAGDNLSALVEDYESVRESSQDAGAPFHVWGQVQDAGEYRILAVEGWQRLTFDSFQGWMSASGSPTLWNGTIQHEGGRGVLVASELMITGAGEVLWMPDLPSDLSDGTAVYVQGIQVDDRLEWQLIQEHAADEGMMPPPPPAAVLATVEQVDLIYYASPLEMLAEDLYANYGYRSVQPVWRFRGHTDQGAAFEAYVQAVAETHLIVE